MQLNVELDKNKKTSKTPSTKNDIYLYIIIYFFNEKVQ